MLPVSLFVCVSINGSGTCGDGGGGTPTPPETFNIQTEDGLNILAETGENIVGE